MTLLITGSISSGMVTRNTQPAAEELIPYFAPKDKVPNYIPKSRLMSLAREYNNLMQSNEVAGSKQYGKFVEEYFPVNALVEGYDPVGEKYGVTPEILPDTAKYFSRRGQPWEGPETPEGTYKRVFHYKTYGLPMDRFGDQARVDSMTPAQRIKWWNGNTRHLPKDAQGRTINHLKKVESMRKHLQDPRNEPFRRAWTEQTGNWE